MKPKSLDRVLAAFVLLGGMWLWAWPAAAQFGLGKVLDKVARAADAQREWTIDEEKSIGEATAVKMISIFGLLEQPQTQKYVTLVGRAVSQFAARQNFDYRFGILDTEIVNAFAAPGGYIFVTRGLLANVESEAELAGVLAHEVIHTSERHLEKELRSRKMAALAIEEGTQRIPQAELARLADRAADTLLAGKLSRDKEDEADSKGLDLMAAAGYDPRAFPEFLNWLGQSSGASENRRALGILLASHPKIADRVKSLEAIIAQRGWDKEERPRLPERYEASVIFTPAPPGSLPAATAASAEPAPSSAPAPASPQPAGAAEPAPSAASPSTASSAAKQPATASAPDLGPGGSGTGWDLYSRPFSAVQVITSTKDNKQMRMKIYARQQMFRMDMEEKGEQMIMIMRFDRNVMVTVMPKQKSYLELSLKLGNAFYEKMRDPKAKVEREELGRERVGQYNCIKYRMRVTSDGETHTGILWSAQELDGFMVKMMDEKGEAIVEYQDIQLTAPDLSVFEIPAGYQKIGSVGFDFSGSAPAQEKEGEQKQEPEKKSRFPLRLPRLP